MKRLSKKLKLIALWSVAVCAGTLGILASCEMFGSAFGDKKDLGNGGSGETPYVPKERLKPPEADPPEGIYATAQEVTLTTTETDAKIFYTLDGSNPISSLSKDEYEGPITVPMGKTLKAYVSKTGRWSSILVAEYTLMGQAQKPKANPTGGTYVTEQHVSLSSAFAAAHTIRYKLTEVTSADADFTFDINSSSSFSDGVPITITSGSPGSTKFYRLKAVTLPNDPGVTPSEIMNELYIIDLTPAPAVASIAATAQANDGDTLGGAVRVSWDWSAYDTASNTLHYVEVTYTPPAVTGLPSQTEMLYKSDNVQFFEFKDLIKGIEHQFAVVAVDTMGRKSLINSTTTKTNRAIVATATSAIALANTVASAVSGSGGPVSVSQTISSSEATAMQEFEVLFNVIKYGGKTVNLTLTGSFTKFSFRDASGAPYFTVGSVQTESNPGDISKILTITLPTSVTEIDLGSAGITFSELTSISRGSTADIVIKDGAFQGCEKLTTVSFASNITQIGDSAFSGCTALKVANNAFDSKLTKVGDYAFQGCTTLVTTPGSAFKLNNVTYVGSNAFGSTNVQKIELKKLAEFGQNVFAVCGNLSEVLFDAVAPTPIIYSDGTSSMSYSAPQFWAQIPCAGSGMTPPPSKAITLRVPSANQTAYKALWPAGAGSFAWIEAVQTSYNSACEDWDYAEVQRTNITFNYTTP
jgi:hypothetical protein